MTRLTKLYVAHFYDSRNHSFNSERVAAPTYNHAELMAKDWAAKKYPGRVKKIVVEKSKGEVLADY